VTYDDASVTAAIKDVKDIISDAKDGVSNVNDIFSYAVSAFYGICFALTILGFVSWMCGNGCCSMWMGVIGAGFLFLSWLLFAIFYGLGVFLDDTCVNLSDHFFLDCMLEPGKTCQRAKLTDMFQCPDITKVSAYYAQAYNLLDTNDGNGAGQNQYGNDQNLINGAYSTSTELGTATIKAPAALANAGITTSYDSLGMEPWTTCKSSGYSFNDADTYNGVSSSSVTYSWTTPLAGNRNSLCEDGSTNTNQDAPQNTAQTIGSWTSTGLASASGSTNPPWAESSSIGGGSIGSCERACLNASATAKEDGSSCTTPGSTCILDSLTNYGGNSMFRKFVYESFTSVYSTTSTGQGYASCGDGASSSIAWVDVTAITDYATYQNSSSWMTTYAAASTSSPCIPYNSDASTSRGCAYTTDGSTGYYQIPFTAGSASNPAACLQGATMAVSDIMYALSYIASCEYIKTFAYQTAVQSSGACFDLGDGLTYLTAAQGLNGVAFFFVTVLGIMGYRRWDTDNFEEQAGQKEDDHEDVLAPKPVQTDDAERPYEPNTQHEATQETWL
jgi:hypothetical protein